MRYEAISVGSEVVLCYSWFRRSAIDCPSPRVFDSNQLL